MNKKKIQKLNIQISNIHYICVPADINNEGYLFGDIVLFSTLTI